MQPQDPCPLFFYPKTSLTDAKPKKALKQFFFFEYYDPYIAISPPFITQELVLYVNGFCLSHVGLVSEQRYRIPTTFYAQYSHLVLYVLSRLFYFYTIFDLILVFHSGRKHTLHITATFSHTMFIYHMTLCPAVRKLTSPKLAAFSNLHWYGVLTS